MIEQKIQELKWGKPNKNMICCIKCKVQKLTEIFCLAAICSASGSILFSLRISISSSDLILNLLLAVRNVNSCWSKVFFSSRMVSRCLSKRIICDFVVSRFPFKASSFLRSFCRLENIKHTPNFNTTQTELLI